MRRLFESPVRSLGTALTIVGGAIVFVVLVLPSIAAGGRPNDGKDRVTGYANQKGDSTHVLHIDKWFYVLGGNFQSSTLFDVLCWESREFGSKPQWTSVSNYSVVNSKTMSVDLKN